MSLHIRDAFGLVQELTGVSIHLLNSQQEMEDFCAAFRFHTAQSYLTPHALEKLFNDLGEADLLVLTDCFRIRFLFVRAEEKNLSFGPFCTEHINEAELRLLLPEQIRAGFPTSEFLSFRNQFPVLESRMMLRYAHMFLHHICSHEHRWLTRVRDYSSIAQQETKNSEVIKTAAQIIEERYRIEQQMVEHIKAGRATAAVDCYLTMEQSVAHLKSIGNTLERARVGAAITRTTVRHAAFRAGLPALLIDKLSSANTAAVGSANSIQEINDLVQKMIRNFCSAIYQKKNENYSKLILCMIYAIEHDYRRDLSVSDLAEELDVSVDYLIKRCKQETGITPNAYIRKVRMEAAAQLLRESPRSVQEISTEVGILDANYFVKLFKQEFGQTPSAYRAERLL